MELLFLDGAEAAVQWQGDDRTYGSRHYVETARKDGSLRSLRAMILVDMVADRDLRMKRDLNSTPWLTDIVWEAARREKLGDYFSSEPTRIEDDHLPFIEAGVPAVDLIDLEYAPWHTAGDTLDAVSARSLQVVGDVLLAALPNRKGRAAGQPFRCVPHTKAGIARRRLASARGDLAGTAARTGQAASWPRVFMSAVSSWRLPSGLLESLRV
jgi:hypothetical protein